MAKGNKVVIWIENKQEIEIQKILEKILQYKGIELCHVFNIDQLAMKLDEIKPSKILGFIIDMMLDGPNNLSSFKKPEVAWDHDDTDAGQIILEYILKNDESEYIMTPTMILSVRSDIDDEYIRKFKNTEVVIKRDMVNLNWLQELKLWIEKL